MTDPAFRRSADQRQKCEGDPESGEQLAKLIVVLKYYEGLSTKEIAAAVDLPPDAVQDVLDEIARGIRSVSEIAERDDPPNMGSAGEGSSQEDR